MAWTLLFPKFIIVRPILKAVEREGPYGRATAFEEDGQETVDLRVDYDSDRMQLLCQKAAGSDGLTAVDGPLRVTVVSSKRVELANKR